MENEMPTEQEFNELLTTVRYLKDRQDILDCIVRESRARDRQDIEQIASCWAPDGVDEHGPNVVRMPDYPEAANAQHRAGLKMTSHNITNHLCEIDGDKAYCESYVIGGLWWKHGKSTSVPFGRYLDQLERRDGKWLIVTRRCTIELTSDGDPNWVYSEEIKGFLKGQWSKEDPSYERPITWKPKDEGIRW
jgi:SnoaL-like domain